MSCYTAEIEGDKYYCLDGYFAHRTFGYVKMTEEEKNSHNPWELLDWKSLKGRGGKREVLRKDDF